MINADINTTNELAALQERVAQELACADGSRISLKIKTGLNKGHEVQIECRQNLPERFLIDSIIFSG